MKGSWRSYLRSLRVERALSVFLILLILPLTGPTLAEDLPRCLPANTAAASKYIIADHLITDQELLARLVYAEGLSTGFADNPLVYEAIAWGVMNRVILGEVSPSMCRTYGQGIRGVIFKKGQFNPAVSRKSQFSKAFLCPDNNQHWAMAKTAAATAMKKTGNPFIKTRWEMDHDIALVVNFYYPQSIQAKGPLAPWEGSKSLRFIGDIRLPEGTLSASIIRFYRLNEPPKDLSQKGISRE